jgi:hypothetical protein
MRGVAQVVKPLPSNYKSWVQSSVLLKHIATVWEWGCSSTGEHLPDVCEALG